METSSWPEGWPEKGELHVFDPDGDVLLIFDRCVDEEDKAEPVDEGKKEKEALPLPTDDLEWWRASEPEPASLPPEEIREAEEDGMSQSGSSASALSIQRDVKPRVEKVQMRVSSKHLILASPHFRASLGSSTFSEGRTLQSQGTLALSLPDDDPDAMAILLSIIHGTSRGVPRQVDLNMLSKLAVAVNHRQLHDAVALWSDTWIENAKKHEPLPSSYTPERALPWLYILWVFKKEEDFRKIAQMIQEECDHYLESEIETVYVGRYIPASVITAIQEARCDAIESLIAVIHNLITKYSGPHIVCDNNQNFFCDANLLGSLLKESAIIGIWPRPEDPYPGIKVQTLAGHIRRIRVIDECSEGGRVRYGSSHSHGIKNLIEASTSSLQDRRPALHLAAFLPEERSRSKKDKKKKHGGRFN